jgi:hypothetical protein
VNGTFFSERAIRQWVARHKQDEVTQLAVLALIELAANQPDEAIPHVDRLLELTGSALDGDLPNKEADETLPNSNSPSTKPSDAAVLLMSRAIAVPQLREAASVFLARCNRWVKSTYQRSPAQRHVAALTEQLRAYDAAKAENAELKDVADSLTQWHIASSATAATRGSGCPPSKWIASRGQVENVSNHEIDYLYFHVPLKGDFDVECDVSVSGWRATSLAIAGQWLGCVYTLTAYDSGTFRYDVPAVKFAPPLTRVRNWVHYRTTLRNNVASTYFNGRLVQQRVVERDADPWLAIRNMPRNYGAIRNLRISGSPVVPDEITLSENPGLTQWHSYYGETVGDSGDDWVAVDGVIRSDATPSEKSGIGEFQWSQNGVRESLLRYHRPLFEDGLLSYDFFYSANSHHTHPTLDRMTLFLDPSGVQLHWITDGPHDRTGLSPTNMFDEPGHRRGPEILPLRPDDWNHVELRLAGDVLTLALNGVDVFERPLEETNQRSFGLFHYADRTSVEVRNIVWRGDWPRHLPPVGSQELATVDADFLAMDDAHLSESFQHDFREKGFPLNRFTLIRGNAGEHVKPIPEGLLATRSGTGGYLNATVAPALRIEGDFDITAEYEQFEAGGAINGAVTIGLIAELDNASTDEYSILRRHSPKSPETIDQIAQCLVVKHFPEGERRSYFSTQPMEEQSGRLRLIRRGNRVYYLTAEGDSSHFQLRGEQPITSDAVGVDGLRLFGQIHQKGGQLRVVWKRLFVRAQSLSGRAVDGHDLEVVELNRQRDELPQQFTHDFKKQAPSDTLFYQWSIPGEWSSKDSGWLIKSTGSDQWTSCGLTPQARIVGDFDATVRFRAKGLAQPKAGKYSQCYLQLEAADEARTQVSAMFTLQSSGEKYAGAQAREQNDDKSFNYRSIGRLSVTGEESLRIARRGRQLTLLAVEPASGVELVIARYDFSPLAIDTRSLRFMVHTGGADRVSEVVLESFDIRAREIEQPTLNSPVIRVPQPAGAPPPANPPKGLLDRFLDYFK